MSVLKKDNTGYHLKHLFIGSEGTLGIITKIAMQCPIKPKALNVAIIGLDSFENVLTTFRQAKMDLNEILVACEMMDAESMNMVETHLKLRNPIGPFPFYMFVGTAGNNLKHDEEKLSSFLEKCFKNKIILDGVSTCEPSKYKAFWDIRERFAESFKYDGYVLIFDLSFPLTDFYKIVEDIRNKYGKKVHRVSGMGHLGDGNLHLQISLKDYNVDEIKYYENIVYSQVVKMQGSISAEHGIGFLKRNKLKSIKSSTTIKIMRNFKALFDPNNILNPYKMLD